MTYSPAVIGAVTVIKLKTEQQKNQIHCNKRCFHCERKMKMLTSLQELAVFIPRHISRHRKLRLLTVINFMFKEENRSRISLFMVLLSIFAYKIWFSGEFLLELQSNLLSFVSIVHIYNWNRS